MPKINNEILIWARETCGLMVEEAARKLQIKDSQATTGAEKLLAYESGKTPSRSLLLRMSKQYRKPLLTFYMERPPIRGDRGEDYRNLPIDYSPVENGYVDVLIRDIKARQSILREALIDEDEAEVLSFVGSKGTHQNFAEVAKNIQQTLKFDIGEFRKTRTTEEAFKYLRNVVEGIGVYVILAGNLGSHHSNIDTTVFRGFVLADKYAPFVVINDQDAKSAWSFTLLHEIAHLWLGQTGVSGFYAESKIEQFCNNVASEILLPDAELAGFNPDIEDFESLTQAISSFSRERKISNGLVSYRLLRQGVINKTLWMKLSEYFKHQWLEYKSKKKAQNRMKEGGPSYFVVRRNKLGNALLSFAERMMQTGVITTTKAGLLLGVKPLKVHKLFGNGGTQ